MKFRPSSPDQFSPVCLIKERTAPERRAFRKLSDWGRVPDDPGAIRLTA
jgi:hypothetical protein